jgi:hypothetical protein
MGSTTKIKRHPTKRRTPIPANIGENTWEKDVRTHILYSDDIVIVTRPIPPPSVPERV